MEALGGKDKQLAQLVDASNAVFATFAKEDSNVAEHAASAARRADQDAERPGQARDRGARARPDAARAAAVRAARSGRPTKRRASWRSTTTPIIKNEIRPFAREILPTINADRARHEGARRSVPEARDELRRAQRILQRARATTRARARAASCSSSTGPTTTSTACVSSADANGVLGRTLVYFNCEVAPLLKGVARSQPEREPARRPAATRPDAQTCQSRASSKARRQRRAHARRGRRRRRSKLLGGLAPAFGEAQTGKRARRTRPRAKHREHVAGGWLSRCRSARRPSATCS